LSTSELSFASEPLVFGARFKYQWTDCIFEGIDANSSVELVKSLCETLDFIDNRRKQTNRFASIVQQVIHSDIHTVAVQNDLTDEEVWKGSAVR